MGWNSSDGVTEAQKLANVGYMREHLLAHGWNLITVDIQWYEPGASTLECRKDAHLTLDALGRLLPAKNRFPSAPAGWRVDFVKVDDLSRPYFDHLREMEAIRKAIDAAASSRPRSRRRPARGWRVPRRGWRQRGASRRVGQR